MVKKLVVRGRGGGGAVVVVAVAAVWFAVVVVVEVATRAVEVPHTETVRCAMIS